MEILKSNFEEKLPLIKEALLEADFISIDTELTGLTTPDVQFQTGDDIAIRYSKIKSCVQEFTIIQFGVCAFKRDPATENYIAKPFNFYIFGADTAEIQSRRVFSASASSLTFLRSNKFDFNKLIDEGIPFYNYSEESSMYQSNQGTSLVNRRSIINESTLTKANKSFLEYNRNSIQKWLQDNTEKPLIVQVNSNFYKKLIYQEVQDSKYNGFLQATQRDSKHVQITRLKEEERRKKAVNSPKLNFRTIIELIRKANCPVIAHNAVFDIFHTVDQFWQYLPNNIQEFKKIANSMWPTIVDTKYLAEYHPALKTCFTSTVLGTLYNDVYNELKEAGQEIIMAENFDRYSGIGGEVEHEAAYDAYMTGAIYLAFIAFIREKKDEQEKKENKALIGKRKRNPNDEGEEEKSDRDNVSEIEEKANNEDESSSEEEGEASSDDSDDEFLKKKNKSSVFMDKSLTPYYGRIFLMRSEIPYINLKGEETVEIVTYPNKFYLHNIPTGLTNTAIEKLYPTIQPIAISWINENNAWIILKDETKIPFVKLGMLGLSVVHSFLPGCSRQIEGEAYGITKEASKMELITHEQYLALYGPNKTVNYNNAASIMNANNVAPINNDNVITSTASAVAIAAKEIDSTPKGGSSYDELDIPLPPSFAASLKRNRVEDDNVNSQNGFKNRKLNE
ncbi:ribonuclease H-like domain-containing protein [Cokeromyces recurvatus]|uniref:ribonuclease H-like domain-containing protein n=1 Tax=Cokeromyces recurvatus TaxID=90255 RepID=UPI00221E8A9B|nr:ribonuclease H-like domain-containing protein [Cokeromyces recurvatus]KAI7907253.1 ribonuclease H-like domain-containing protein [Cokeromyces recurvatus]